MTSWSGALSLRRPELEWASYLRSVVISAEWY